MKYEVVYHRRFATRAEARSAIFDYIEVFYNRASVASVPSRSSLNETNLIFPKLVSEESGQAQTLRFALGLGRASSEGI